MKEFNENPFKKDTQVSVFSNASQAEDWQENNCEKCAKNSKCLMEVELAKGWIRSTIELWAAKEIGAKYDALNLKVELNSKCQCFDDGTTDLPF